MFQLRAHMPFRHLENDLLQLWLLLSTLELKSLSWHSEIQSQGSNLRSMFTFQFKNQKTCSYFEYARNYYVIVSNLQYWTLDMFAVYVIIQSIVITMRYFRMQVSVRLPFPLQYVVRLTVSSRWYDQRAHGLAKEINVAFMQQERQPLFSWGRARMGVSSASCRVF